MIPMILTWIFIILVIPFLLIRRRPAEFPPGPISFRFVGNVFNILWARFMYGNKGVLKLYLKYRKKYGKIFSIDLAGYRVIVLNDHVLVREAWGNSLLTGRLKLHGAAVRTGGVVRGILLQDGEEWLEQRRFTLRHLRDFGFGKKSMENIILDEVVELIQGFRQDLGKPISTQTRFNIAVLNSLWSLVAGQRYKHDDPEMVEIIEGMSRLMKQRPGLVFFMPWIKTVAPKLSGWDNYVKELPQAYNFLEKFVRGRLASYDGTSPPEHFTDVYINEIRKTTDSNSSFYKERGEATLTATLLDLFFAGAETTSTTLTYIFLYLTMFTDKQEKLHEEIDRVLGTRLPSLEDRQKMPYAHSIIMETLRYSSMVPFGLYHKAVEDTYLHGYMIPKDTWVSANLYAIHHDPVIWGDPENFRPERFISKTGGDVIKHEALLPFSSGKRVCLGESLARDELFLFTVAIFQKFRVEPDPYGRKLTTQQIPGMIITTPVSHELVLKDRNN